MLLGSLDADVDIAGVAGDAADAAGGSLWHILPAGIRAGNENLGGAQGAPDIAGICFDIQRFCVAGGNANMAGGGLQSHVPGQHHVLQNDVAGGGFGGHGLRDGAKHFHITGGSGNVHLPGEGNVLQIV